MQTNEKDIKRLLIIMVLKKNLLKICLSISLYLGLNIFQFEIVIVKPKPAIPKPILMNHHH